MRIRAVITELVWERVIKKRRRFRRGFRLSISLCVFIGDAASSGVKISCSDTRFRMYEADVWSPALRFYGNENAAGAEWAVAG